MFVGRFQVLKFLVACSVAIFAFLEWEVAKIPEIWPAGVPVGMNQLYTKLRPILSSWLGSIPL